jgi:peroxin-5
MSRAYPHLKPDPLPESISGTKDPLQGTDGNPWASLNRATSLFLAAAREGAAKGTIDPEVQVGLGVLFYSNSSYEQARDCFNTALQARPNDFLLWNRLGATLANSGKPEDAIEAYHKALELRPTFTRAIYNLSVACESRLSAAPRATIADPFAAQASTSAHTTRLPSTCLLRSRCSSRTRRPTCQTAPRHRARRRWPRRRSRTTSGARCVASVSLLDVATCLACEADPRLPVLVMDRMDLAQQAHVGSDLGQFRAEGFEF